MTVPGPGNPEAQSDTEFDEADLQHETEAELQKQGDRRAPASRFNPVTVAARRMLLAAIGSEQIRQRMEARGIIVVVQVPSTEWLTPIAEQWRILCRFHQRSVDCDRYGSSFPPSTYAAFFRDGSQKTHLPSCGNDTVAEAVWAGLAVVGFAVSPDTVLPRDLVRAADIRLYVSPLDSKLLGAVIAEVYGRAKRMNIPEGSVPKLSPNILKLAWREKQTPKEYLGRLTTLAHMPTVGRPGPALDGLHGMDDAVRWGLRFAHDLEEYKAGRIPWSDMSVGLLLHGVPGTGKTLFAEALAKTTGLPLIATSFAEWQASGTGYLGDYMKAMRASFEKARQMAPCIMLIDEMDAFGARNASLPEHRDYWTGVITGLLEQMDGVRGREGVLLIGTTNDHTVIDKAIVRSGRMDRLIEVRLPDRAALIGILRHHLRDDLDGCDLSTAAGLAVGGSGADCARWVRDARQIARHEERAMTMADLMHEIGGEPIDPAVQMRVAVHEAGHAVATCVLRPGALVSACIGNGGELGAGAVVRAPVRNTRAAIHSELLELLAGRAAEEVLLGDVSGGCGGSLASDLAHATCLAVTVETALGLGTEGLVFLGLPTSNNIGMMLAQRPALAVRVAANLHAVYREAVDLITAHRDAVGAVARCLVDLRALTGPEIAQIVADHPAPGCPA